MQHEEATLTKQPGLYSLAISLPMSSPQAGSHRRGGRRWANTEKEIKLGNPLLSQLLVKILMK